MKLLFLLVPLFSFSQKKWTTITKNDATIIVLQGISGAADGINQSIVFDGFGKGKDFWDFKTSWQNKYKDWPNDKREAFPLSKTLLVAYTDGYHLTRMISRWTSVITVGISFGELKDYDKKDIPKVILKKILLSWIANRTTFTIVHYSLK